MTMPPMAPAFMMCLAFSANIHWPRCSRAMRPCTKAALLSSAQPLYGSATVTNPRTYRQTKRRGGGHVKTSLRTTKIENIWHLGTRQEKPTSKGVHPLEIGTLKKLTPMMLFERSVPNCAGPEVSTTLPKKGWETICTARGGSCSFCCWLDSSIISCMKRMPSSAATALTA